MSSNKKTWQSCLTKTASVTEALGMYKLASKKKSSKEKKKEKKKKGIVMRGLGATAGGGMMLGATPVVSAMANPYHNVYHGTNLNSADLIFNNELDGGFRGLSTQFAGQAGRLNEKMLANTAIKSMYDLGIPLTEEQEINLVDKSIEKMRGARGTGKFNSVDAVLETAKEELSKTLDKDQVNTVLDSIKDNVVRSGKRIYTSTGPATVSEWADVGDELGIIKNRMNLARPGRALGAYGKAIGNLLTGGMFPELKQRYANFKFNRAANKLKSSATREQTSKLLSLLNSYKAPSTKQLSSLGMSADEVKELGNIALESDLSSLGSLGMSADEFKELASMAAEGRLGASIGTRLPVGEAAMLNDFPGLSTIMAINPGIKHTAADILPNLDPSRDLSVASDIPIEHFRSLDLVDNKTGKPLRRIMLDSPVNPKITAKGLGKGLLKASPYAALAALGADMVQANVRDEDMYTGRALGAGYGKVKGKLKSLMGKEAGLFSGSTLRGIEEAKGVAKSILPTIGYSTAAGLAADAAVGGAMDKLRDTEAYKQRVEAITNQNTTFGMAADEARLAAEAGLRSTLSKPFSILGGAIGGGLLPRKNRRALGAALQTLSGKKLPSQLKEHAAGLAGVPIGAYMGVGLADGSATMSAQVAEGGDFGTVSPMLAPLDDTEIGEAIKEKAPGVAALPIMGALAAIPITAGYAGRKYYGGHLSKATKALRDAREGTVTDILRSLDEKFVDKIPNAAKRNKLRDILNRVSPSAQGYDEVISKAMEGAPEKELQEALSGNIVDSYLKSSFRYSVDGGERIFDEVKTKEMIKNMKEKGISNQEILQFLRAGGAKDLAGEAS